MGSKHERDLAQVLEAFRSLEQVVTALQQEAGGVDDGLCMACGAREPLSDCDVCEECLAEQHGARGYQFTEMDAEEGAERWVDELRHDYQLRAGGW